MPGKKIVTVNTEAFNPRTHKGNYFIRKRDQGAGEMAQGLIVLHALKEDWSLVSRNLHERPSRRFDAPFCPPQNLHS